MSRIIKKADKISDALYTKSDKLLDEKINKIYKEIKELVILSGAGMKVSFGSHIETNKEHTPDRIEFDVKEGAGSRRKELLVSEVLVKIPILLRQICQESHRNKTVNEFVSKFEEVTELTDQVEWLNENTVQNP